MRSDGGMQLKACICGANSVEKGRAKVGTPRQTHPCRALPRPAAAALLACRVVVLKGYFRRWAACQ